MNESKSNNGALVQVEGVEKVFHRGSEDIHVLADLNLQVPAGEFLALMGPSGSGKSTLLNLIGGLDRPTNGSVSIAGERIDQLSDRALAAWRARHVGFVFQLYNLMPVLTAERNVELPLLLTHLSKAERQQHVETALAVVGLVASREALSAHAFRRRTAARRHRARHRHRPDAAALRRADGRPGPQGGRRNPGFAPGAEPRARQDHHHGHARSARLGARRADGVSRQRTIEQRAGEMKHAIRVVTPSWLQVFRPSLVGVWWVARMPPRPAGWKPALPTAFSHEVPSPHLVQSEAEEAAHVVDAAVHCGGVHPVWISVGHPAGAGRRRGTGGSRPADRPRESVHHQSASDQLRGTDRPHSGSGFCRHTRRGSAGFTRIRRISSCKTRSCRKNF